MSNTDIIIADRIIGRTSVSGPDGTMADMKVLIDGNKDNISSNAGGIATNLSSIEDNKTQLNSQGQTIAAFSQPTVPTVMKVEALAESSPPAGKLIYVPDGPFGYPALCFSDGTIYRVAATNKPLS